MAVNPNELVLLHDYGVPSTFQGGAASTVSGGQFVYAGSKAAPVDSGTQSYTPADILVTAPASGTNFPVGVALQQTTSGTNAVTTVLTKGIIIATADGAITAGQFVGAVNGAHALSAVTSGVDPIVRMNRVVGRALTSAGSAEFVVAHINL